MITELIKYLYKSVLRAAPIWIVILNPPLRLIKKHNPALDSIAAPRN